MSATTIHPSINVARLEAFTKAYEQGLRDAVRKHPGTYLYGEAGVPLVVDKMIRAIAAAGSVRAVNYTNSPSFRRTCKALEIAYTGTAMDAYLRGEVTP